MCDTMIFGNRRFTCLSPTLVRLEFAPGADFESRRSMTAYEAQQPVPFAAVERDGAWDVLKTEALAIRTRDNGRAFSRVSLEIRWSDGRLCQIWRPGDPDYQNLGGTLRSLDRYGGESCDLDGVHPATMKNPDPSATNWPAWIQCEIDPLLQDLHPNPPEGLNRGHWLREAQRERNDGRYTERTFNWYKDARKFSPGILSAAGYYLLNDSDAAVLDGDDFPVERDRPGYQDWYFFGYAHDYKQALQDFRLLAGPAPVPPFKALGIIFSRWPAFTEDEVREMARAFAANGYPLSTLVMDMEWHKEGWGNWDFNPELIPDPEKFFALCKKLGLDVTFNDHPLDVREDDSHFDAYVAAAGPEVEVRTRSYNEKELRMAKVDICDKQQNQAFRETCHQHIMDLGLNYWWNDGSRGQMSGTCGQFVSNKTFWEESERDGRRGFHLARYGGFGSHRYGGFFTGDDNADYHVLRLQVEFNIRAGQVGMSLVSHDIGGFMLPKREQTENAAGVSIIPPVRYLRWLQFGVFGPVLRFHCAPGSGSRLPYDYDNEVGGECRRWLRIRHSLLPYIYTALREHYDTGIPLTRALYLEHPEDAAAYRFDEYYYGPAMLVAPVVSEDDVRRLYLPTGTWWEFETATQVQGGLEIECPVTPADVPVYVKAGSIIPRQNPDGDVLSAHIDDLMLDVYPGAAGTAELYEDDGVSPDYRNGTCCRTRFELEQGQEAIVIRGAIVQGKPLGEARRITIDVSLENAPCSVIGPGSAAMKWQDLGAGRYRIALPEQSAAAPFEARIICP